MAKITIETVIDTEEGTMEVSINGEKIKNASSVSCYKYHDSYENKECVSCNVGSYEKDEEAGVVKTTTYYSMSSREGKAIAKADAILNIPGFVGRVDVDPTQAMAAYFKSKSTFG